ncbi:lysophospholipid acyltransferase family protein [Magnetospirillum sp. UT-4]|uniref:lysophospholipid acyltransferase family protein n=1 Tax=Magnetospirillum sp. UT-4 TaxID=2681467 RepID=UPI001382813F|nr:lysophospholipid acyltransferase family protein [Magnetospirillum sp. UT-4]CAA7620102.1 Lipid A biosynthesis lauroyl acyltransferase [Magnetospirillum sp. UT-4]
MRLLSKSRRQSLEAIAARLLWGLFAALPLDAASGLAGAVGRLVGPHLKVSDVARRNLAGAFPDWDAARIEATLREVWDNMGRVAGEFPHIATISRDRVEVVGGEVLDRIKAAGGPGLFVSAHLANWELSGATVCGWGIPVALVYRAANNPHINEFFARGRAPSAVAGQIAKGPEGAREIMAMLKRRGFLGLLVDQKMNDGIAVPFFGRDAMTAPAVARFAARFGIGIVPVQVERLRGARFRITFHQPLPTDADTLATMTEINRLFEEWIRARPGQWLWLHRRWPD